MNSNGQKKDETRFTIRFNPTDPRHHRVMTALKASGRRKASLIADAVCEYLERHDRNEVVVIPVQTNQGLPVESVHVHPQEESTESTSVNDDLRNAVLEGLSMFKA